MLCHSGVAVCAVASQQEGRRFVPVPGALLCGVGTVVLPVFPVVPQLPPIVQNMHVCLSVWPSDGDLSRESPCRRPMTAGIGCRRARQHPLPGSTVFNGLQAICPTVPQNVIKLLTLSHLHRKRHSNHRYNNLSSCVEVKLPL